MCSRIQRPVDLGKGYDALYGLVKQGLNRDPLSGDLFLFSNRRRRGCKVLVWDGTGLCIFQKRLECCRGFGMGLMRGAPSMWRPGLSGVGTGAFATNLDW